MRKGSVTVLSLLIMAIILLTSLSLIYMTKLQSHINSSSGHKIQSLYLAELKLNKVLFDDKYYKNKLLPSIEAYVKTPTSNSNLKAKIYMDKNDLDTDDDNNFVDIEFFVNKEKKHMMEVMSKSCYNGVENEVRAYGTLINDLYHYGDGKVVSKLNNNDVVDFIENLGKKISTDNLPSNITGIKTFDKDYINIDYKNITYNTLKYTGKTSDITEEIFLVIKNKLYTPIILHIGEINKNKIKLKGVIYLEGDLVISTEFQLNGILILKGGQIIVNTDTKPLFKGIIITDGEEDYEDIITIQTNYQDMCKYGLYLPGFIEPKIEIIKKH